MAKRYAEIDEIVSNFQAFLTRVKAGETILIVDNLHPIAELKPLTKRPIGLAKGDFTVPDDFNDPLPASFWAEGNEQ